jgi:hypothetical protein
MAEGQWQSPACFLQGRQCFSVRVAHRTRGSRSRHLFGPVCRPREPAPPSSLGDAGCQAQPFTMSPNANPCGQPRSGSSSVVYCQLYRLRGLTGSGIEKGSSCISSRTARCSSQSRTKSLLTDFIQTTLCGFEFLTMIEPVQFPKPSLSLRGQSRLNIS